MKINLLILKFVIKKARIKIKYLTLFFIVLAQNQIQAQYDSMHEIFGENGELFGYSISMSEDGQRIAIGSPLCDTNGIDSGKVEVFEFDGVDWIRIGDEILGDQVGDRLGYSLEISSSGNKLIIGSPNSNGVFGKFKILEFDGTSWIQTHALQFNIENLGLDVTISHNEMRYAITSNSVIKVYELDESNNSLTDLGEPLPESSFSPYGNFSVGLSYNGEVLAVSNGASWCACRFSNIFSFDGNNWNLLGDHSNFLQANGGCNGNCPPNDPSRVDISNTDPVKVISSQMFPSSYNLRVLEYMPTSNHWNIIGTVDEGAVSYPDVSLTDRGSPFMLSGSGDYILTVNTGWGENRNSYLKIYDRTVSNIDYVNSIPLPQLFLAGPMYQNSFKGLSFSEISNNVGIGLPTYDSVRIYNINSVLNLEDYQFSKIEVYPNPTKNILNFNKNLINDIKFVKIYNSNMQLIKIYKEFDNANINISEFNSGFYFMSIELKGRENVVFKKVIKE